DLGRSIFIVATNYEERIDGAIKRQGRFDHRLLLSLPDTERRGEFLWQFIYAKMVEEKTKKDPQNTGLRKTVEKELLDEKQKFIGEAAKKLLNDTALFGWGDLKHLVKEELRISDGETWEAIVRKMVNVRTKVIPSVRLSSYRSRFDSDVLPFEE